MIKQVGSIYGVLAGIDQDILAAGGIDHKNNTFEPYYGLGVVDDSIYFRGLAQTKIDLSKPFIIVYGARAVGKSTYCRAMSLYDRDTQYLSVQRLNILPKLIRRAARKVYHIEVVDL